MNYLLSESLLNSALFFIVFFIFFLLTGILITFILSRKGKINLITLVLYSLISGLFFQLAVSFLSNTNFAHYTNLTSATKITIISSVLLILIVLISKSYKLSWWKENLKRINAPYYDIAVFIICAILILLIFNNIKVLPYSYFNPGSDQYYWLTQAKFIEDQPLIKKMIVESGIIKRGFPYLLSIYTSFMGSHINDYQKLILFFIFFSVILKTMVMAQLGKYISPIPALGLLAPLMLFTFYWENYYILSAGIVPQNLGVPLFLIGFIILHENKQWDQEIFKKIIFLGMYLLVLYFIYVPALVLFLITQGITYIVKYFLLRIKGYGSFIQKLTDNMEISFALIATLLAIIFIYYYSFYSLGIIPFPPDNTTDDYHALTLVEQPYLDSTSESIIKLGIMGLFFSLLFIFAIPKISPALIPIVISSGMAYLYLTTPLITRYTLHASWQPFRYFFYLLPGLVITAIFFIATPLKHVQLRVHPFLSKFLVFCILLVFLPSLLLKINDQQGYVYLNMIVGADKGELSNKNANILKEVSNIIANDLFLKNKKEVLIIAKSINNPDIWYLIFAPNKAYVLGECQKDDCLIHHQIDGGLKLSQYHPQLLVIEKNIKKEEMNNLLIKLKNNFNSRQSSKNFDFYYNAAPNF